VGIYINLKYQYLLSINMKLDEIYSTSFFQGKIYYLTSVIETRQTVQGFEPQIKKSAIAQARTQGFALQADKEVA